MDINCSYNDCENSVLSKGLCGGHYQQQWKGKPLTSLRPKVSGDVLTRLLSKVSKIQQESSDSCWDWLGYVSKDGYGQIGVNGVARLAHREMYYQVTKEDLEGFQVDHMCHNTRCVNPKHLRAVTAKQNVENAAGPSKKSKTGVRGVFLTDAGTYKVRVGHNYKIFCGGTYANLADAEVAAANLRNSLFTHNIE